MQPVCRVLGKLLADEQLFKTIRSTSDDKSGTKTTRDHEVVGRNKIKVFRVQDVSVVTGSLCGSGRKNVTEGRQ